MHLRRIHFNLEQLDALRSVHTSSRSPLPTLYLTEITLNATPIPNSIPTLTSAPANTNISNNNNNSNSNHFNINDDLINIDESIAEIFRDNVDNEDFLYLPFIDYVSSILKRKFGEIANRDDIYHMDIAIPYRDICTISTYNNLEYNRYLDFTIDTLYQFGLFYTYVADNCRYICTTRSTYYCNIRRDRKNLYTFNYYIIFFHH